MLNEQYLNDPEDVTWLLETHLLGVILPDKWKGFRSYIVFGNEDCPEKVWLYKSQDALVTDPWFEIVFYRDQGRCTGQEFQPAAGPTLQLETVPVDSGIYDGVLWEQYRGESMRFEQGTAGQVRHAVAELQAANELVRVFYGNPSTGRAAPVASLVVGRLVANLSIGAGTGGAWRMPKLQLAKAHNGARLVNLPTPQIVGILRENGEWAYQHPDLHFGKWSKAHKDDAWLVACDDKLEAKFREEGAAKQFIAFMTGRNFNKPKRREFL